MAMGAANPRVPVVVVSGVPGAGKSSVLERLVVANRPSRVGWVVQHLPADPEAPRSHVGAWQRLRARLEESDGCLHCALREDLVAEALATVQDGLDALVVEQPGVLPTNPAAQTIHEDARTSTAFDVTARVTVVDAGSLLEDLQDGGEVLALDGQLAVPDDALAELAVHQVEQADALVLAEADACDGEELAVVSALLRRLNPSAPLLRDTAPELLRKLLRWRPGLAPDDAQPSHSSTVAEASMSSTRVSSVTFQADRPFHPERFVDLLREPFEGVLRGRGLVWLASRPEVALRWDHAGPVLSIEPDSLWSPTSAGGQQLELVGLDLDARSIRTALRDALLTDDELAADPERWRELHQGLPSWQADALSDLPIRHSLQEPT